MTATTTERGKQAGLVQIELNEGDLFADDIRDLVRFAEGGRAWTTVDEIEKVKITVGEEYPWKRETISTHPGVEGEVKTTRGFQRATNQGDQSPRKVFYTISTSIQRQYPTPDADPVVLGGSVTILAFHDINEPSDFYTKPSGAYTVIFGRGFAPSSEVGMDGMGRDQIGRIPESDRAAFVGSELAGAVRQVRKELGMPAPATPAAQSAETTAPPPTIVPGRRKPGRPGAAAARIGI